MVMYFFFSFDLRELCLKLEFTCQPSRRKTSPWLYLSCSNYILCEQNGDFFSSEKPYNSIRIISITSSVNMIIIQFAQRQDCIKFS